MNNTHPREIYYDDTPHYWEDCLEYEVGVFHQHLIITEDEQCMN